MLKRRYCEMCDEWFPPRLRECPECGLSLSKAVEYCAACDREGATAGGDTTAPEFHTCNAASLEDQPR
jgi:predicted amidophosphoribosyltransferase